MKEADASFFNIQTYSEQNLSGMFKSYNSYEQCLIYGGKMKKIFIPVFILAVGAMILISAWPSITESRKPINMFIAKAKAEGTLPLLQFVNTQQEGSITQAEIAKFNSMSGGIKLSAGVFIASENMDSMIHYNIQSPGFIIFDADGKVAVQQNGLAEAAALLRMTQDVHTH
jgi:hypothetical protein